MGPGAHRPPPDTADRIVGAAAGVVARLGFRKATVEDIADAAGVSRATVYRWFPGGKEEVVSRLVDEEVLAFFSGLRADVGEPAGLEDLLVEGLRAGAARLAGHALFQALLRTEADELAVRLAARGRWMQELVRDYLLGELARHRPGLPDPLGTADWLARMVLSFLDNPGSWDLADPAQVRELVRTELLAGVGPG